MRKWTSQPIITETPSLEAIISQTANRENPKSGEIKIKKDITAVATIPLQIIFQLG